MNLLENLHAPTLVLGTLATLVTSWVIGTAKRGETAICILRDEHSSGPSGHILLECHGTDQTKASCNIWNLTPGEHGLHVHRSGDLSEGCESTCDHYNPTGSRHGGPTGANRHRGDFGNITADLQGVSRTVVVADVTLGEILGRSFVVHQDPDDLGLGGDEGSHTTGNAGKRIACGKIVPL